MGESKSERRTRAPALFLLALPLLLMAADPAEAQSGGRYTVSLPRPLVARTSPFELRALGDLAIGGLRSTGDWGMCFNNMGFNGPASAGTGCEFTDAAGFRTQAGSVGWLYTEISFYVAAPPSDLPPQINRTTLRGGGWTVNRSSFFGNARKMLPSDRSGRELLAVGVLTTADGSCRDGRSYLSGYVEPGKQILPSLTCPETWPAGRFDGARLITEESFLTFALGPDGMEDPFAFWRVPASLQDERFLGTEQLYAEFSDWTVDLQARYGNILPGGSGDPQINGWPLGVTVHFNAFYYTLPTIRNTYFWRATVVNDSYKLYGDGVDPSTGVDYDSLYMGINPIRLFPGLYSPTYDYQYAAQYLDPKRNAVLMNKCGDAGVRNGAVTVPYYSSAAACASESVAGFDGGGMAIIFLRSPLGDTRNKLLSDPESPFFNPTHPSADDTLTLNRMSGCGFVTCTDGAQSRSERAYFGLLAGSTVDWLDGRARTDFADNQYWNTVQPHDWPNRGDFNRWVPGDWDYDEDGIPDEMTVQTCHGTGPDGCVALWSDTLPGRFLNMGGQAPHYGVGPVSLRSGDTTSFLIAFSWEADSASIETQVNNVIDFYMSFYFGPEPAPPPELVAVGDPARPGTVATAAGSTQEASVTLMWQGMGDYRDRFVEDVAQRLVEAPVGSPLGNIRVLNPWIVDSLNARITNNLVAVHLFKSCDAGATFTADASCFPTRVPAGDQTSKWRNHGWLPYATLSPSTSRITDLSVQPGVELFYSLVTETQGAIFDVYTGTLVEELQPGSGQYVCVSPDCRVQRVEFAPAILSPLKTTPGGQAVRVYVPLSRPAGYREPQAVFEYPPDQVLPPVSATLVDDVRAGQFTALFADSVEVVEIHRMRGLEDLGYTTTARLLTVRPVYDPNTGQTQRQVIAERELVGATQFAFRGTRSLVTTAAADGDVTLSIREGYFGGPTMVVARGGTEPIFATAELAIGRTTPAELLTSRDYPGFMLDVAGDQASVFRSHLALTPAGDTISPSSVNLRIVRWLHGGAQDLAGMRGHYEVEWLDHPFGPGRQFRIDRDPTDEFLASIAARNDAERSVTGPDAVAALQAAGFDIAALNEYSLPFRVRNVTTGEPVQVAVIQHRESMRIGVNADTFRIFLPESRWMPGDRLVLIEPVPGDSTINGGVVLDGSGNPIPVRPVRASWAVTFGCGAAGFEQCNPVLNGDYLTLAPGSIVRTTYNSPLTSKSMFTMEITPAVLPGAGQGDRVDLSKVTVVPNPYIVFSEFERNSEARVIKFTNLPPSGTIYIYTVSGQLVQRLTYTAEDLQGTSGDLPWNMVTRENTELGYGLYLYVLESEYGRAAGQFVVMR